MSSTTNDALFPTILKLQKETTASGLYRIIDQTTKKIFPIANKLLHRNEPLPLPPTDNEKQLADYFNNFFVTKIGKIMSELVPTETHPTDQKYIESSHETLMRLENFWR